MTMERVQTTGYCVSSSVLTVCAKTEVLKNTRSSGRVVTTFQVLHNDINTITYHHHPLLVV